MQHNAHSDSPTSAGAFPTDPTGLPEATCPALLELADGEDLHLRIGPVAKRIGDATVRMLGYNGSIPGPTLKVQQGSEVIVHVTNDGDLEATVHWHGLRLENKYDGVPHETQTPIPVGGSFTYRIRFPVPGLYWYHPHIREDYTQEMGLYGNLLVVPADPGYWLPAHRDVLLTLDDLLIEDGKIAPFSPAETTYTAMGRFGNVLLISGEPDYSLTVKTGEVVRLWLTNTANTRVFNVQLPGARMKLVGGDSGRVEHQEFLSEVILAPSERAVIDVLFGQAAPGKTMARSTTTTGTATATVTAAASSGKTTWWRSTGSPHRPTCGGCWWTGTAARPTPPSTGSSPSGTGSRSGWSTRWTPTTPCTTRSTCTGPAGSWCWLATASPSRTWCGRTRCWSAPGRLSTSCSTSPSPGCGWRTATSPSTCKAA